jgi:8-oxo-dGTP diphosphatase
LVFSADSIASDAPITVRGDSTRPKSRVHQPPQNDRIALDMMMSPALLSAHTLASFSPPQPSPAADAIRALLTSVPSPIPVVAAIIEDDSGRVLLAQRPARKHLALKWEFPGGKVDTGETPEAALVREIREELACAIVIVRPLPRFTHDYGTVTIAMIPFVCRLASDSAKPHPQEHAAIRWVTRDQLGDFDLAPADWPVVADYRASLTR